MTQGFDVRAVTWQVLRLRGCCSELAARAVLYCLGVALATALTTATAIGHLEYRLVFLVEPLGLCLPQLSVVGLGATI